MTELQIRRRIADADKIIRETESPFILYAAKADKAAMEIQLINLSSRS